MKCARVGSFDKRGTVVQVDRDGDGLQDLHRLLGRGRKGVRDDGRVDAAPPAGLGISSAARPQITVHRCGPHPRPPRPGMVWLESVPLHKGWSTSHRVLSGSTITQAVKGCMAMPTQCLQSVSRYIAGDSCQPQLTHILSGSNTVRPSVPATLQALRAFLRLAAGPSFCSEWWPRRW